MHRFYARELKMPENERDEFMTGHPVTITIEVSPSPGRAGRFIAALAPSGRVLGAFSAPLCGAARVLLEERLATDTPLYLRHAGSETIALRSTVGAAAGLTVSEEGSTGAPQFTRFKPFDRAAIKEVAE
jgi:hypothetical protein